MKDLQRCSENICRTGHEYTIITQVAVEAGLVSTKARLAAISMIETQYNVLRSRLQLHFIFRQFSGRLANGEIREAGMLHAACLSCLNLKPGRRENEFELEKRACINGGIRQSTLASNGWLPLDGTCLGKAKS